MRGQWIVSVTNVKEEYDLVQGDRKFKQPFGAPPPSIPRRRPRCAYGDSAWDGKPAAVIGASVGTLGTARAQYHLRQVFVFLNMHALNRPEVMISNAALRFDAQGRLTDTTAQDLIRQCSGILWTGRVNSGSPS